MRSLVYQQCNILILLTLLYSFFSSSLLPSQRYFCHFCRTLLVIPRTSYAALSCIIIILGHYYCILNITHFICRLCSLLQHGAFANDPALCFSSPLLSIVKLRHTHSPSCLYYLSSLLSLSKILVLLVVFALNSKMAAFAHFPPSCTLLSIFPKRPVAHSPCLYFSSSLLFILKLPPAHFPCLYFSSSLLSIPKLRHAHSHCFCCSSSLLSIPKLWHAHSPCLYFSSSLLFYYKIASCSLPLLMLLVVFALYSKIAACSLPLLVLLVVFALYSKICGMLTPPACTSRRLCFLFQNCGMLTPPACTSHRLYSLFQNGRNLFTPPPCTSRRLCSLFQNGSICSLPLLVLLVVFALNSKMAAFAHSSCLYFSSSLLSIPKWPHLIIPPSYSILIVVFSLYSKMTAFAHESRPLLLLLVAVAPYTKTTA
jgi:hypothetical protein